MLQNMKNKMNSQAATRKSNGKQDTGYQIVGTSVGSHGQANDSL